MIVAKVEVEEYFPDMFSVKVDGEIIATFQEADEGILAWYPAENPEPEHLTVDQAEKRLRDHGEVEWIGLEYTRIGLDKEQA